MERHWFLEVVAGSEVDLPSRELLDGKINLGLR
jgi:hypothetical protein